MFYISHTAGDVEQLNKICGQLLQCFPTISRGDDHQYVILKERAIRLLTSTQMSIQLASAIALQTTRKSMTVLQLKSLL